MRQTNHNGRINANTGVAYSRKHNDRQYDVTKAENIVVQKVKDNIIIHYDCNNQAHKIDNQDPNRSKDDIAEEMSNEISQNAFIKNHFHR